MATINRFLAVLIVVAVGGVDSAPAQACGSYQLCSYGEHAVPGPAGGGWLYPHFFCALCVGEWCHPACGMTSLSPPGSLDYAALVQAAERGDIVELLRLRHTAPEYVTLNRARNAIQVWSCSGTEVIASLPLPYRTTGEVLTLVTARHSPNRSTSGGERGTWGTGGEQFDAFLVLRIK